MRRWWSLVVVAAVVVAACGGAVSTGSASDAGASPEVDASAGIDVTTEIGSSEASPVADGTGPDSDGSSDTAGDEGEGCNALQAAAPTFALPSGAYVCYPTVVISTPTPNATIFYTLDHSDPSPKSAVYTSPFRIAWTTTVRAYATAPCWRDSTVSEADYTINIPPGGPGPPIVSPQPGKYAADFDATLTNPDGSSTLGRVKKFVSLPLAFS